MSKQSNDAVRVIRCRDCIHRHTLTSLGQERGTAYCDVWGIRSASNYLENGFCHWGEDVELNSPEEVKDE